MFVCFTVPSGSNVAVCSSWADLLLHRKKLQAQAFISPNCLRELQTAVRTQKLGYLTLEQHEVTGTLHPFSILSTPQPRKSQILDITLINPMFSPVYIWVF